MSVSDRSVIFLVSALLAAATVSSAGIVEQNTVFKNKIFELRGQQLANSIDAMMYSDKGQLQKRLAAETDLSITAQNTGVKLILERDNLDDVEVPLDSSPDTKTLEDISYICVEKNELAPGLSIENLVDVEGGKC